MTNKISNSNKSNIHIHIGDKGRKKRRNRRKTESRGHGGTYVNNNITVPVTPLFNRPQTFDHSLGDDRERERIRIQRGIFESQIPSNNASNAFGNGAPANDYESFVGNVKRYMREERKSQKPPPPPPAPPAQAQPKTEHPPAPKFNFVLPRMPPTPTAPAPPSSMRVEQSQHE